MASIERRGSNVRVVFYHGGRRHRVELGETDDADVAAAIARIEANQHEVIRGRLEIPAGADIGLFLLTDGKRGLPAARGGEPAAPITLADLDTRYRQAVAVAVEPNTLATIAIHLRHILASLGAEFPIGQLSLDVLQGHVDRRRKRKGTRGRPILGYTIGKEIGTLRAAWNWAVSAGLLAGEFPGRGLKLPRGQAKTPFRTRDEIERLIDRGGLGEVEQADAWDGLYLVPAEVDEVLAIGKAPTRSPFFYPMLLFAAHTGARRSELIRARRADIDLETRSATIREKKRAKGQDTTRTVPLSAELARCLNCWLAGHPGGQHLFCRADRSGVTKDQARDHFDRAIAGSRWSVMRGWHVMRHSFISTCAVKGIDVRIVQSWVGHMTADMTAWYTHISPTSQRQAMDSAFG